MALKSDRHPCVTLALIASMPRVFEAIQDKCITKANCKKDSKQFYVGKYYWKWFSAYKYRSVILDQVLFFLSPMSGRSKKRNDWFVKTNAAARLERTLMKLYLHSIIL